MLPEDTNILLSVINMKLRDEYDSLESLADGMDEDVSEIRRKLEAAGFKYDEVNNQFR